MDDQLPREFRFLSEIHEPTEKRWQDLSPDRTIINSATGTFRSLPRPFDVSFGFRLFIARLSPIQDKWRHSSDVKSYLVASVNQKLKISGWMQRLRLFPVRGFLTSFQPAWRHETLIVRLTSPHLHLVFFLGTDQIGPGLTHLEKKAPPAVHCHG